MSGSVLSLEAHQASIMISVDINLETGVTVSVYKTRVLTVGIPLEALCSSPCLPRPVIALRWVMNKSSRVRLIE